MDKAKEKGVTCACGRFHQFGGYVYAHWTLPLTLTCECGIRWSVLEGVAERMETKGSTKTPRKTGEAMFNDRD